MLNLQTQTENIIFNLTDQGHFLLELRTTNTIEAVGLTFSLFLYLIGLFGMIFNYKNFIVTMMSVELMYLGVISSFVYYGVTCHDGRGNVYGLFLLVLAACESAVGLGIIVVLYRFGRSIDFASYQELGG